MIERTNQHEPSSGEAAPTPPGEAEFPTEPFPCPACGQLLAPAVRVCVACKKPIDISQIKRPISAAVAPSLHPKSFGPRPVEFSWSIFFIVLVMWCLLAIAAQRFLGPVKSQWMMAGFVIGSSVWVFYDAQERGVPKPLRWGLCSLLLWILVFPWYLARRKAPEAPCPFVEADVRLFTRVLLFVLMAFLLISAVLLILHVPPAR